MSFFDRLTPNPSASSELQLSFPEAPLKSPNVHSFHDRFNIHREFYLDQLYSACFDHNRPLAKASVFSYRRPHQVAVTLIQEQQQKLEQNRLFQERQQRCYPPFIREYKRLDAPDIDDDFYMTSLSAPLSGHNKLSVILGAKIFVWSQQGSQITMLPKAPAGCIPTCVRWLNDPNHLLTGYKNSLVTVTDIEKMKALISLDFRCRRIGCAIPASPSQFYLGSRAGAIFHLDMRTPKLVHLVGEHSQRVCGLALHPANHLLASGGNDNIIKIWDIRFPNKRLTSFTEHTAAVKALAWAPGQSELLFSGGGMQDKTIKALSISENRVLSVESSLQCQVTGLHVSAHNEKLISCHGNDQNVSVVWEYKHNRFIPVSRLEGHECRVLHSALMPDGETLVTGSPDETIRFWKVFDAPKAKTSAFDDLSSSLANLSIR